MELAKIYVSESCAQVISKKPIPAGLVGGYIDVVYAEDLWADLSKTVVFRSNITRDVVTDGRRVPVPADVLAAGVRLWVGFFGVAGDKALPTFWASLGTVGEAADPSGDETTDPALPVWAQILDKTAELDQKVEREYQPKGDYLESSQLQPAIDTALAQAKESGAFDGPPGKDGIDGQDGAPGKSAYEYAKDGGYTGTEEEFAAKLAAENPGGADWNAAEGEPGHVKHRTHWVDFEPVALAENITMRSGSQYSNVYYNAVKDSDVVTVIYDGVTYVCPVTLVKDITEFGDESYFYIGNFRNAAPDYPFSFWGYIANQFSLFTAGSGDHVLSVYVRQEKTVHKLDKKFIPADIGTSDWNAAEGQPGHVLNRTHWVDMEVVFPETELTYIPDFGNLILSAMGVTGGFVLNGFCPIRGRDHEIVWNGETYYANPGVLYQNGIAIVGFGNFAAFTGEGNTGEPFVIANFGSGATIAIPLDGDTSPTVEIKREVTHEIPEKFRGVFFVDVRVGGNENGVYLHPSTYVTYGQIRLALAEGKTIVGRVIHENGSGSEVDVMYTYYLLGFMEYKNNPHYLSFTPITGGAYMDLSVPADSCTDATVYEVVMVTQ